MADAKTILQKSKEIAMMPADVWIRWVFTIFFLLWVVTEGKEQWFPTYNSDDVIAGISKRLEAMEQKDVEQDMEQRKLASDYVQATNTMQRLNEKLDRELMILQRDVERNYSDIKQYHQ